MSEYIVKRFYRTDWRNAWGWVFTEDLCKGKRLYFLLSNGAIVPARATYAKGLKFRKVEN